MKEIIRKGIEKYNERGVVSRTGPSFHTPSEFALKNLYYIVWSDQYVCSREYHATHDHLDNYSIIQVLEGAMEFIVEGEVFVAEKNEAVILNFDQEHYYRSLTDDMVKWEVIFNGSASGAYYELLTETWGNKFTVDSRASAVLNMMREELREPLPQDHKLSYLLQLLFCTILDQHKGGFSPEIKKAIQYMYDRYSQDIQINEIADYVSLSRSYFSKLFSRETGYAPREYLQNLRIRMAQDMLLSETGYSLSAIAENCGFANASHFCKVFKKRTGKSPNVFRKSFFSSRRPDFKDADA